MSEKLPQPSQNEEVDLGQLFNAIGKLFEKFFNFIGKIFKGIFSTIIYAIKPFVVHFKIVAPLVVVAAILGYVYESFKEPVYYSEMIVKPYFDSKYQLSNDINYFNTLIRSNNNIELSNIFEIDTSLSKELISFDFEAGPETPNDLFLEYDEYVKSVDTSLVDELSYIEFINNRDLLSGRIFTIKVKSYKNDIFPSLQEGFRKTFENEFSKQQKSKRDTVANIERETLIKELSRLDSIQKTYLEAIRNESEKNKLSVRIDGMMPLQQEKTATKEYELFQKELEIRYALRTVNQDLAEENRYFDVLSDFNQIGTPYNSVKQRYTIIFPVLILAFLFLIFLGVKVFNFIKNYE